MSQEKGFNVIYSKCVQKDELRTSRKGRDLALVSVKRRTSQPRSQRCTTVLCEVAAALSQQVGQEKVDRRLGEM